MRHQLAQHQPALPQLEAAALAGAAEEPDFSPDFAAGLLSELELDSLFFSDLPSPLDSAFVAGEVEVSVERESFR